MSSERAQIRDPRVRKLANEIIKRSGAKSPKCAISSPTCRREMPSRISHDPPTRPGTVEDALANTLISQLDRAPMPKAEADRVLSAEVRCTFNRPEANPILWTAKDGSAAAIKLNGVLVALKVSDEPQNGTGRYWRWAPDLSPTARRPGRLAGECRTRLQTRSEPLGRLPRLLRMRTG